MKEQMRILIGYDGSSCADAALDDLRRAGLPRNAEVLILTVLELWLPLLATQETGDFNPSLTKSAIEGSNSRMSPTAFAAAPVSETMSLAQAARARLQSRFPTWDIKVEEAAGSPAHEILKRAAELKPHLILIGCQGRSALGGFLLGSVSQKVVNEADCSVRVSRGTAWKDGSPVRIVIGLDGTPGSELAVNAVAARVWPSASEVRLITVVDPEAVRGHVRLRRNSSLVTQTNRDLVERFAKEAVRKLRAASLVVSKRIDEGDPKQVLIANAEEWGADCIFIGASAASNLLERLLLGSVATAIVGRAHCSVEVARPGY